jgi:dTDP-4-amino-4,6-dideoxygalactose transaminase
MYRVPLSYTPVDYQALNGLLESYAHLPHTEVVTDFEKAIGVVTGSKYVVATTSGTAAIHLALRCLGVTTGDIVLAPTFTYVASLNPILYEGAVPFLLDSERVSWNIDPALLEDAIRKLGAKNKMPKALILVHNFGMPAQLDEIVSIATRYEIPIVEDAAEALGSQYNGRHVGTFGTLGILSFNNNKIITSYGGGAVLANDERRYHQLLKWSTQSREPAQHYEHRELGFNYRMSALNAAMGLVELKKLGEKLALRRSVFEVYKQELKPVIETQHGPPQANSNRWLSTVLFRTGGTVTSPETKLLVQEKLFSEGIETRQLWKPMHMQPLFARYDGLNRGVAEEFFARGLALPSGSLNPLVPKAILSLLNTGKIGLQDEI